MGTRETRSINRMSTKRTTTFLLVTTVALLLYLPFLSVQYDTNGIIEATAVESGPLLNKNHLLYRPIGFLFWSAVRLAGYAGNSLHVLQCLTAIAGALGVGFAYLAFQSLVPSRSYAAAAALALGTSYTYWVTSTDVYYIPLAAMFAAAALAVIVNARSTRWLIGAGTLTGLSIITWQANAFLVPALLLVAPPRHRTLRGSMIFVGTVTVFAGAPYVAAAIASHGLFRPAEAWAWFTRYNEGPTLKIWGAWELARIPAALLAAMNSLVPVSLSAGPGELLQGVKLGRIAVDIAVLVLIFMSILAGVKTSRSGIRFLAAYVCFLPFIAWWDPSHKWFLVPNLFLVGFLVLGIAEWRSRRIASLVFTLGLFAIASTNFITTIRPRRFNSGSDRSMAACVASHMDPPDIFVATEWGWPDYLEYFHHRAAINVINETAQFGNKDGAMSDVRFRVDEIRRAGGQAYVVDPRHYSDAQLQWLRETTGLKLDELLSLGGTPAFVCENVSIQRL